ncbi:MAG: SymE family type I addiction module toxin [Myxococcota bacterium]|nr:SymE family type I addiction module toxin [Myxococcota bacterium]
MKERQLRVSKVIQPHRRSGPVASICLTGRWLEQLGFCIGDRFVVRESPGRIELVAGWVDSCGILQDQSDDPNS